MARFFPKATAAASSGGGIEIASFDEDASTGATFSTLTDPDGDGKNYRLAAFTDTSGGTLVIADAGMAQFLVVAGGAGGRGNHYQYSHGGNGAGGPWFNGELEIDSGSHTVIVGAGGSGGPSGAIPKRDGNCGGTSGVGSVINVRGNNAENTTDPLTSTFAGSSYTYGQRATTASATVTTYGGGGGGRAAAQTNGNGYTGTQGVVYVRVEI